MPKLDVSYRVMGTITTSALVALKRAAARHDEARIHQSQSEEYWRTRIEEESDVLVACGIGRATVERWAEEAAAQREVT